MTNAEMDKMTDHELLSYAEKELKHSKWALIAACVCWVLSVVIGSLA